jgi:nitrate reductase delta subunit
MSRRPDERAALLQAAALLLQYPDARLRVQLETARAALAALRPGPARDRLLGCATDLLGTPAGELERHYVEVLDRKRRCCLHLTWWTDGETRRRGRSLAALKARYRAHGFLLRGGELPDFLPVLLEFGAQADVDLGLALLQEHRPGLELLRLALVEVGTPYAEVLTGLCALLPGVSPADAQAARALARTGPPDESVGLEPFGMPARAPGPIDLEFTGVRR